MKLQILLDRAAQSADEKEFVRGLIAAGLPDVDEINALINPPPLGLN